MCHRRRRTDDGPACAGGECKFKLNKLPYVFGTLPIKAFGDVINHGAHGLIGTLVIEPEGAVYLDPVTEKEIPEEDQWKLGSEALIKYEDEQRKKKTFREFVLAYQDGLNWHWPSPWSRKTEPVGDCPICDDSYDHGEKGINYRAAPFWARLRQGMDSNGRRVFNDIGAGADLNQVQFPKNFLLSSWADIPTPVFQAKAGEEVRFRVSQPYGRARQRAFVSFGADYADMMPGFGCPAIPLILLRDVQTPAEIADPRRFQLSLPRYHPIGATNHDRQCRSGSATSHQHQVGRLFRSLGRVGPMRCQRRFLHRHPPRQPSGKPDHRREAARNHRRQRRDHRPQWQCD